MSQHPHKYAYVLISLVISNIANIALASDTDDYLLVGELTLIGTEYPQSSSDRQKLIIDLNDDTSYQDENNIATAISWEPNTPEQDENTSSGISIESNTQEQDEITSSGISLEPNAPEQDESISSGISLELNTPIDEENIIVKDST